MDSWESQNSHDTSYLDPNPGKKQEKHMFHVSSKQKRSFKELWKIH